jgi:hypothetical protein
MLRPYMEATWRVAHTPVFACAGLESTTPRSDRSGAKLQSYGILLATYSQFLLCEKISPVALTKAKAPPGRRGCEKVEEGFLAPLGMTGAGAWTQMTSGQGGARGHCIGRRLGVERSGPGKLLAWPGPRRSWKEEL